MNDNATKILDNRIPAKTTYKYPSRHEGNFIFLMDPVTREFRIINNSGTCIYELCDGKRTVRDIIGCLREVFTKIPEKQLRKDVYETLQAMERIGVVTVHSGVLSNSV